MARKLSRSEIAGILAKHAVPARPSGGAQYQSFDQTLANASPTDVPAVTPKKSTGGGGAGNFLMEALKLLDTPRSAVLAGAATAGSAIGGHHNEKGFLDRFNAHQSFGDILAEKHILGKGLGRSALGLTGDVFTDPLTYVGGVGVAKHGAAVIGEKVAQRGALEAAQTAARVATEHIGEEAAQKLLTSDAGRATLLSTFGSHPEVASVVRATEEATARAARTGVSKLSREEVARFLTDESGKKIADRGLAFAGHKIPLTDVGPLAKIGEKFAEGKAVLGDVARSNAVTKRFIPNLELATAIKSGEGKTAYQAVQTKLARATAQGESATIFKTLGHEFHDAVRGFSEEDFKHLAPALEGDVSAIERLGSKFAPARDWYARAAKRAQDAGLNIQEIGDYHPRQLTEQGRQLLKDAGLLNKNDAVNVLSSQEKARTLLPDDKGVYHFLGEDFHATTNAQVTEHVNRIAGEKLREVDPKAFDEFGGFFNPNPKEVAAQYARTLSNRIAQADAATKLAGRGVGTVVPGDAASRLLTQGQGLEQDLSRVEGRLSGQLKTIAGERAGQLQNELTATGVDPRLEAAVRGAQDTLGAAEKTYATAEARSAVKAAEAATAGAENVSADLGQRAVALRKEANILANKWDEFKGLKREILSGTYSPTERKALWYELFVAIEQRPHGFEQLVAGGQAADQALENSLVAHIDDIVENVADKQTLAQLEKALKAEGQQLGHELQSVNGAKPNIIEQIAPTASTGNHTVDVRTARDAVKRAADQVDVASRSLAESQQQTVERVAALRSQLAEVQAVADSGSAKLTPANERIVQDWLEATQRQIDVGQVRADVGERLDEASRLALGFEETASALKAQLAANKQLLDVDVVLSNLPRHQVAAISDEITRQVASYKELRSGIQTPREVADWLTGVERLATPDSMREFMRHYDGIVNWMKAWQITTPGFHVRNVIGGEFNNALAGVDWNSRREFIRAWSLIGRGKEGRVTADELARFRNIEKVVGSGQIGSESAGSVLEEFGGRTRKTLLPSRNNVAVRASRATGEHAEFYLRGALAWDVMKKGGTLDDAVSAVHKFHFNYQDLSQFEQGVRKVIPFYTWTRKNLPLQIEQIIKQPKYYVRYLQAKNEIEAASPSDSIVPGYFSDLTAIRLPFQKGGGHVYATPDLPSRDLAKFSGSPGNTIDELAATLTPVVKTPIELFTGQQFFKHIPISDSKFVPVPLPATLVRGLTPALKATGLVQEQDGQLLMTEKDAYALGQAVPIIARYRSGLPKEAKYDAKRMTTLLSLLGLSSRTNTTDEQNTQRQIAGFKKSDAAKKEANRKKAARALAER